jgi:hypothetical protein
MKVLEMKDQEQVSLLDKMGNLSKRVLTLSMDMLLEGVRLSKLVWF